MRAKVNAPLEIDANAWPSWTAADVHNWLLVAMKRDARLSEEGSWAKAILPRIEEAGIDGPTLLELTEDDLKEFKEFNGAEAIASRKAFLTLVRTLPRSSSNDALNDYMTAGEALAIVYALVLSVVVGLLASLPDLCDGQYEGDNGSTR